MKKRFFVLLGASALPFCSFAQWQPDTAVNNPVCTAQYKQISPQSASDGQGGIITCWQDNRNGDGLQGIIYAQRMSKDGVPKWDTNGIRISSNQNTAIRPKIISDGQGGAFISWIDYRFQNASGSNSAEADVFAQHLDSNGHFLWQQDGIAVDSNANSKAHIALALAPAGGLYLVWDEFISTLSSNGIYAQRVDSAGIKQWNPRISVGANPVYIYAYEPKIISDGRGGFLAAWYDNRSSHTDDIYVQRINSSGSRVWNSSDVRVCNTARDQYFPQMTTNGANGLIVTWQDDRANSGGFNPSFDIYAQSIDSSGVNQWSGTGIPVCIATQLQIHPTIVSDQNGGAFISWTDRRNGVGNEELFLQHLDQNGDTLLQANGILCTDNLGSNASSVFVEDFSLPSMIYDKDSGLTVAWCSEYGTSGMKILAQRINAAGTFQWDSLGKTVCSAPNSKLNVQLISSTAGEAICVWQDTRAYDTTSSNDNIYASIIPMVVTPSVVSTNMEPKPL
ncbi:MAG: hypothetical protein JST06_11785, partial [Bacteroidetes bacterium]|nr:hypothetical protein [Bacteroidota bacterium]